MSERQQNILIQVACSACLFCLAGWGPVLWLTAILVCLGGTAISLYRYRCMQGQPYRLRYLLICLLWLWGSTAINLLPGELFECAPLTLGGLFLAGWLTMWGSRLSTAQKYARLGSFFLPVGLLALIPYGPRDIVSGSIMAAIAFTLMVIDTICNLIGTAAPRTRNHPRWVTILLLVFVCLTLLAALLCEPSFILPAAAIAILAWGRRISDHCQMLCGISDPIALCALRTLLALAPLGAANYLLSLL
ncbi:MAG: hypothetical protein IJE66_03035 [Akkermansia sp.]|nr:hypothetical protein [Akkermansia sp.]